ncbi:MAG TPA: PD-(D/E)XK nuclease family protein [Candidatus Polarisedimenticolia bacterium]|jgi:putative RecB family exonuclease|nr:PD-(D/E)XK nuclease family protein [Candidatus Polarisedimenticolia bacterium]
MPISSIYSHSRLSSFEKCRLQYKYRYVDRIRRDVQGIEAFMGNRVHEALDKLYRDLQMEKKPSLEDLTSLYHRSWESGYSEKIRIVKKEYAADHYRKVGERCIVDFYKTYDPFKDGVTLGLEEKVGIPLDPAGKYRMEGYVDRIVRVGAGTYEVHDYKTGNSLPSAEDLKNDRQLPLYQLGVQAKFSDAKDVRLVWHYLAFNQELRSARSPDALEGMKARTVDLIQRIEATQEFPPTESALCRWCDYQEICPLWKHRVKVAPLPENEYLKDSGVRLVDRFAELESRKATLEKELGLAREAVLAMLEKEKVTVLAGTKHEIRLTQEEAMRFPSPGETGWKGLEMVLKEIGALERFSSMDSVALSQALRDPETDRYLKAALEKFATAEKTRRLRLLPRGKQQLDLFE